MKKIDQLKEYIRELHTDAEYEMGTTHSFLTKLACDGYLEALDDIADAIEGIWDV